MVKYWELAGSKFLKSKLDINKCLSLSLSLYIYIYIYIYIHDIKSIMTFCCYDTINVHDAGWVGSRRPYRERADSGSRRHSPVNGILVSLQLAVSRRWATHDVLHATTGVVGRVVLGRWMWERRWMRCEVRGHAPVWIGMPAVHRSWTMSVDTAIMR